MFKRLLLLNGLATLGVVLNHASAWGFIAMFWWPHNYRPVSSPNFDEMGSAAYFTLRAVEQLIIFTIPSFLFVSGCFIAFSAGRQQKRVSWSMITARLRYLIIPYLFWTLLLLAGEWAQGISYTPWRYAVKILTGGATPAFYFVPLLCQLYLLAPVLVPLARERAGMLLALSLAVQLLIQGVLYLDTVGYHNTFTQALMLLTPSWLFPRSIFWFACGMVVGFNMSGIMQVLNRYRWPLLGATVLLLVAGIVEWELLLSHSGQPWIAPRETILDSLYAGMFIFAFLAFQQSSFPFARELGQLGSRSFGIYLIHSAVLELASRTIYHTAPWVLAHQLLFQPILILLGLAIPLLIMALANINRSPVRGYYQYLFG